MQLADLWVKVSVDQATLKKGLDQAKSNIEKNFEKIRGVAIKASAAVGAALVAMGTKAVFAAADVQALNAQFEQVFGEVEAEARKMVDEMGETFGMLPSRLQAPFSTMTSMFKGLGYDTEEAMNMAKDAVTLAADAAAFYDKSYEDANAALNSFLKGNYEGGEAIGLFGNETQIAAFAAEKLGISWKNAGEAQKQLARLEYAKAMQEAAGATGQAAREADQFSNQLGNLKQAWVDFLATAGAPLLEPAIDIIKEITSSLQELGNYLQSANIGQYFDDIGSKVEGLKTIFGDMVQNLKEGNYRELGVQIGEGILAGLEQIGGLIQSALDRVDWKKAGASFLAHALEFIIGVKDAIFDPGWWKENWGAALEAILIVVPVGKLLKIPGAREIFDFVWPKIKGGFSRVIETGKKFLGDYSSTFIDSFLKGIGTNGSKIAPVLRQSIVDAVKKIKDVGETFYLRGLEFMDELGKGIGTRVGALIKEAKTIAGNFIDNLWLGLSMSAKNLFARLGELWAGIRNTVQPIIREALQWGREIIQGLINGIRGKVTAVQQVVGELAETIKNKIKSVLGISSPSRVMAEFGRNVAEGLAAGMREGRDEVAEQAERLIRAITDATRAMLTDLSNTLSLTLARLELENLHLGDNASESARLNIELKQLAAEKENLAQKIEVLTAAYDMAKEKLGESSETTKQYSYELQMAQIELEKLDAEIRNTTSALNSWERVTDSLKTKLEQVRASFYIVGNQLSMAGTEADQLKNEIASLNNQISIQKQIIDEVNAAYEQMRVEKGENSEEAERLKLRLLEEQKALSDLEKQLYDTRQALRDHAQEFQILIEQIDKVEKKYRDDLASALDEYQRKVTEVNQRLREEELRTTEEYTRLLDERTRALTNFVGLFDQFVWRDVSGAQLLENLRGQVEAFERWQENIQALAARGVDEGLIAELRAMGPKAGAEIAALNTLTDEELAEYVELWRRKNQEARAEAVSQLEQQREQMEQKLIEIRIAAEKQLEAYRAEWERKNAEIRANAEKEMESIEKKFQDIAKAGTIYGVELMSNFIGGIVGQFDRLRMVIEEARMIVGGLDPRVRFSPSLVDRVKAGLAEIYAAFQDHARKIQSINFRNVAMAGAIPMAGVAGTTNNYGGNTFYITVQGGSSGRDMAESLLRELHRLGVRIFRG